ncbi:MAG: helix-turn-helix domain-containing protein [Candidatus Eremiobacteraeota bacterium]|nr:helix-turn-helix domain-containing protein [Candidatus Eremiobacteraeota bacterium]
MERAFSVKQVAEKLSVHIKTVQKWIKEGKLKARLLGGEAGKDKKHGDWRVSDTDLQEFWDSLPGNYGEQQDRAQ